MTICFCLRLKMIQFVEGNRLRCAHRTIDNSRHMWTCPFPYSFCVFRLSRMDRMDFASNLNNWSFNCHAAQMNVNVLCAILGVPCPRLWRTQPASIRRQLIGCFDKFLPDRCEWAMHDGKNDGIDKKWKCCKLESHTEIHASRMNL